jgi:HAD superfamily hydrolase (TIGR01549 family)
MERGVSFDFGDTIVALDEALLLKKIEREGLTARLGRLEAAMQPARAAYDAAVAAGSADHPWKPFMKALLEHAEAQPASEIDRVVHALWLDQPKHNLWRKLLPGVPAVCRELAAAGVPIGILTNSEGKARTLVSELGLDDALGLVIDSGVLGVAKPDRRIFEAFAAAIGLPASEIVHVGDSLHADVRGAQAAGMDAIWFAGREMEAPPGVTVCADATGLRRALSLRGLLPPR